jgi:hypothetical protein
MRSAWIAATIVVVLLAGIAAYSLAGIGTTASAPGKSTSDGSLSSSSSPNSALTSPSYSSSDIGSSSLSTVLQSSSAPHQNYPVVWGQTPLKVCDEELYQFCIRATIGFSANATSYGDISTPVTSTTVGNRTFIVRGITTTIISGNQTHSSNLVEVVTLVQDALTGQNASGMSEAAGSCFIPPSGFTTGCVAVAHELPSLPPGHPYNVTVVVLGPSSLPCLSEPCPPNTMPDSWPQLSPPETITVPAGTWGTISPQSTTVKVNVTVDAIEASFPGAQGATLIAGIPVVLYSSNGTELQRGVTEATFDVAMGQTYEVEVAQSYGNCTFGQWADGPSNPRTFTTTVPVSFTAVFACSSTKTSGA